MSEHQEQNIVVFPVPALVGMDGEIQRYTKQTQIGITRYTRYHYSKSGQPDLNKMHEAVDIYTPITGKNGTGIVGTPVIAIADATVVSISRDTRTAGNGIKIKFCDTRGNSYTASYRHLSSISENIKVGERIRSGDVLGVAGNTGNARGLPYSILCFGMTRNGRSINPQEAFGNLEFRTEPPRVLMNIRRKREQQPALR